MLRRQALRCSKRKIRCSWTSISLTGPVDTKNCFSSSLRQSFDKGKTIDFNVSSDKMTIKVSSTSEKRNSATVFGDKIRQGGKQFLSFIMPSGYPKSVHEGYLPYVTASMMSSTLSTISGVLSMQSLLFAVGLGSGAIPAAAALNWVIKDGLGQFGGVLFASIVGNKFDTDPKRWRAVSTLAMEGASFIELLSPLAPGYFLLIASFANVSKNVAYLSASASRAAIHKSFAAYENLADVTAKTGSQSILASMLGTGLGVGISALIANDFAASVAIFSTCSVTSIGLTYYALTCVTVKSLSLPRLELLLEHYMESNDLIQQQCDSAADFTDSSRSSSINKMMTPILTPKDVRLHEKWLLVPRHLSLPKLRIGTSFDEAFQSGQQLETMRAIFQGYPFLITVDDQAVSQLSSSISAAGSMKAVTVHLLFEETATTRDVLDGHLVAYVVRRLLMAANTSDDDGTSTNMQESVDLIRKAIKMSLELPALDLGNNKEKDKQRGIGSGQATVIAESLNLTGHSHADRLGLELFHTKSEWNITSGMLESDFGRYKFLL